MHGVGPAQWLFANGLARPLQRRIGQKTDTAEPIPLGRAESPKGDPQDLGWQIWRAQQKRNDRERAHALPVLPDQIKGSAHSVGYLKARARDTPTWQRSGQ